MRSAAGCTWLLHVVSNTLHPVLLERSLLLLAALLAAAGDDTAAQEVQPALDEAGAAAGSEADKQQQQQEQQEQELAGAAVFQQLLQHGLVEALQTVLGPAAAPGAQLQEQLLQQQASTAAQANARAAPAGQAGGGGWSDDDSPSPRRQRQHENSVFQQPGVLLALVGCLEQIAQQDGAADTLLQQMPGLPQQLLQLLLSCHAHDNFEVLVQLLPVLVLYRGGVLPLLLVGEGGRGAACCLLQWWVCVAQTLCDCGQAEDSLDAVDAAWYLLATATRHANEAVGIANAQQVQQLCRCVCEGCVPASSQTYAVQCLRQLLEAAADQPSLHSCAVSMESRLLDLSG